MKKIIIAAVFSFAFAGGVQAQTQAEDNKVKYGTIIDEAGKHLQANNYAKAAEAYTRAMEYNVDGRKTLGLRAKAYFLNQEYKLAIIDLDKLIEASEGDKTAGEAYFMRGASKLALQDQDGACVDFKYAKNLGHELKEGYYDACE